MIDQTIFGRMLQEEWRMHTELFGRYRFGVFPFFVFLMSALGVTLLASSGVEVTGVLLGLHVLVGIFGLQTGSIAFIGTDAMRNVLGDTTYLIFSARTLPISQKRLLGIFLIKDLVYYTGLFLLPITLGFLPVLLTTNYSLSLPMIALLWGTLTATFMFGVGLTMIIISLSTTVPFGKPIVGILAVAAGSAQYLGVPLNMLTPYHLFANPSLSAAFFAVTPIVVTLVVAAAVFNPSLERESRTYTDRYTLFKQYLPFSNPGLVSKMLLDITRSSGGIGKVFFSATLLLLVTYFLLQLATDIIGIEPLSALAYGSLLSLTAFTTYNWITQNDDPEEYMFYPLDVSDLFAAKRITFALLAVPVGLVFYGGMAVWHNSTLLMTFVGAIAFIGLSIYLLGLTVFLAGFSPNEFLFDTLLFLVFTLSVALIIVPVLLIAFLFDPLTNAFAATTILTTVVVICTLAGSVGTLLYSRAAPKWTRHYKQTN